MPCDLILESAFQPRRITQPYDKTILDLSQALHNNTVFVLYTTPDDTRIAVRVSKVLEVVEIREDGE